MTELSTKQLKALPIFATQLNVEKACTEAGVSKDTFYKWNKQKNFSMELKKLRYEIGCESIDLLKLASKKAAVTLVQLLDENNPPAVRRAAANDILNYVQCSQTSDKQSIDHFKMGFSLEF